MAQQPQQSKSFFAQITPIDPSLKPTHPIYIPGGKPEDPPIPTHPIYLPDHPDLKPEHPIFLPPYPSHPIVLPPPEATHPIAPGGPEKPVDPGYGVSIERPTHPIVIPPPPDGAQKPPQGGIPVFLPAQDPTEGGWVLAYVPGYGWMWLPVGSAGATTKPGGDKPPVGVQPTRAR